MSLMADFRAAKFSFIAAISIPVAHLYVDMLTHVFPIALPLLREKFGFTFAQVGLVATVLQVTSSVIQPVFGTISDRWQTNWFIPFGVAWTAATISLLGYVLNYGALLALVFLAGFGTAAFHPRGVKALADAAGRKKGLANATFMLGGNLGFALGPVVATFLFLGDGRLTYSLYLLIPGAFIVPFLWGCQAHYLGIPPVVYQEEKLAKTGVIWGGLTAVFLVVVVRSWVYTGTVIFLPLYLQEQGYDLALAGRILFIFLAAGALGCLLAGYASDIWGRKRVMLLCFSVFPVAMLLFLRAPAGPVASFLIGVAGATIFGPFAPALTLAQELIPRRTGLASGLTLGMGFGVGGLGASASGVISDLYGLGVNMLVLALLALVALPLLALIRQVE